MSNSIDIHGAPQLIRQEQTSLMKTMSVLSMMAQMFEESKDEDSSVSCWDAYQFIGTVLHQIAGLTEDDILQGIEDGWQDMVTIALMSGLATRSERDVADGKSVELVRLDDPTE